MKVKGIVKTMMKSYWRADKPHCVNGFTFLELILVMALIGGFAITSSIPLHLFLYRDTQDLIIHTQTRTLFKRQREDLVLDTAIERVDDIGFNVKGNVNLAQTLRFSRNRKIVIMLGPGRIHE